ncbi:GNAT family N-acetyltransferase [Roseomonas sp. USHLN139]|uniref:GNAT family N-acetyltransferase n=1 Tax=Roseomonas sp. USHLN139 TaxID=3081298 RepID=UPI003B024673
MQTRLVTLRERPELGPQVAAWLWHAFWRENGESLETVLAVVGRSDAERGPPQSFVLLEDGAPAGTASLAAADLDERPDLTPWLAGVYVRPESRGRGHGARLVQAVEWAAAEGGAGTLWLYTGGEGALYRRLGWEAVERVPQDGRTVLLMRKALGG